MEARKWVAIFVLISIFSTALFLLFFVLWIKERKKCKGLAASPAVDKKSAIGFEFDGDSVLVNFSEDYRLHAPKSFTIEVDFEPFSEGTIFSHRLGTKGWNLEINNNRRVAFHAGAKKVESFETEAFNERHKYVILYNGGTVRLQRDEEEIAKGDVSWSEVFSSPNNIAN